MLGYENHLCSRADKRRKEISCCWVCAVGGARECNRRNGVGEDAAISSDGEEKGLVRVGAGAGDEKYMLKRKT